MYDREFTPRWIKRLNDNEVFVFGSNLGGFHAGGAARVAVESFGAVWGQGVGLQGQSYAIPRCTAGWTSSSPMWTSSSLLPANTVN